MHCVYAVGGERLRRLDLVSLSLTTCSRRQSKLGSSRTQIQPACIVDRRRSILRRTASPGSNVPLDGPQNLRHPCTAADLIQLDDLDVPFFQLAVLKVTIKPYSQLINTLAVTSLPASLYCWILTAAYTIFWRSSFKNTPIFFSPWENKHQSEAALLRVARKIMLIYATQPSLQLPFWGKNNLYAFH